MPNIPATSANTGLFVPSRHRLFVPWAFRIMDFSYHLGLFVPFVPRTFGTKGFIQELTRGVCHRKGRSPTPEGPREGGGILGEVAASPLPTS